MIKQDINTFFTDYDPSFRIQSSLMEGWISSDTRSKLEDNNFVVECIQHHGGEDEGTEYWGIWKFTSGGKSVFIRFNGYYQSFCDTEYLGYEFVVPTEVMVIQYLKDETND